MKLLEEDKKVLRRGPTHIDDWVDDPFTDEYASWFFMLHRMPAYMQMKFVKRISHLKLFCTYNGKRYRVTGASRLGDVWLTENHKRRIGYDLRVVVDDCSEWGPEP